MSGVNEQIDEMAEAMEKSTKTPHENLMDTILELGPEGLKAKLAEVDSDGNPLLSKSDRVMIKDALEEMKKATSPSMDDAYQAKFHQGKVYQDTVIQEDKADDDQDEKLVKPGNAKMKHQGDNQPEGIEGQVIKGKDMDDKKEDKKIAEKVAEKEVDEHEKQMHSKTKKCMKKSVEVNGQEFDLVEVKKSAIEMLKSEGVEEITNDLIKGKMKEIMLKEENQLGDEKSTEGKDRGDKKRPEDLKVEKENKAAQDKVNDMSQGQMKKSLVWADEKELLKSGRGGQNFHFNVNEFYDEAIAKSENKESDEDLKKSDSDKETEKDLNDLIEQGLTKSWYDVEKEQAEIELKKSQNGSLVKSFEDDDMRKALGMSKEDAEKILG